MSKNAKEREKGYERTNADVCCTTSLIATLKYGKCFKISDPIEVPKNYHPSAAGFIWSGLLFTMVRIRLLEYQIVSLRIRKKPEARGSINMPPIKVCEKIQV